jgi:hypothetical protein
MEWPAVLTAVSTAAIAVLLALPAVASFLLFRELRRAVRALERFGDTVQREVLPAVQSARGVAEQATQIAAKIRGEVDGLVETSEDLRGRVKRAADATEDRLNDLEALLDVLYEEVEDTALDVAAALRTTRRGVSVIGAVKRAFRRR